MKLFASFLPRLLKSKGLYDEAKAAYILEKMRQVLENHLGKEVQENVKMQKFFQQKVYIKVSSSSWRNEIFPKKEKFLEILRLECPDEEIFDIIIL